MCSAFAAWFAISFIDVVAFWFARVFVEVSVSGEHHSMFYTQFKKVDGVFPEFFDLFWGEFVTGFVWVDFGSVEDFCTVDVSDSRDYVLIHQKKADCGFGPLDVVLEAPKFTAVVGVKWIWS